jgi:hypothetical protein
MRAADYVNEIIEQEIAAGTSSENIAIFGHTSGGRLASIVFLNFGQKMKGGVFSRSFLYNYGWEKTLIEQSKLDKQTYIPITAINNSRKEVIKASADKLKNLGYNSEFIETVNQEDNKKKVIKKLKELNLSGEKQSAENNQENKPSF